MSEVKVNKISPRSGTDVTLGDSGDTFTIPSGATINNQGTAVNFGATGSASWVTTVKTGDFTAVAGEGYFINTTGGEVDVALPAGVAGAVVAIKDYAGTFDTNKVTLVQNGSDKIGGSTVNATLTTEGIAVTLVFIDSTQGWLVTDSGLQDEAPTAQFITATGGTITTVCTNFKVHTFTGPGTFTVCSVGNAAGSTEISYVIVGGGGGGGGGNQVSGDYEGGGGGAGGFREGKTPQCSYTSSPIACTSGSNNGIPVTAQGYPIVVGGGGAFAGSPLCTTPGVQGTPSSGFSLTATGGGGGGSRNTPCGSPSGGQPGGSGGGAGQADSPSHQLFFGAGNTPPVSPSQGFPGGSGNLNPNTPTSSGGGGGGGATVIGGPSPVPAPDNIGGAGGAGATTSISGTPTAYGGGGGGSGYNCAGAAGTGGGGTGSTYPSVAGTSGTTNTGGGGGGGGSGNNHPTATPGGAGGSGIVMIRYKFQ